MAIIYVKPAPGIRLRQPVPPYPFISDTEPTAVEEHPFWWRKLARGEAILCDGPGPELVPNPPNNTPKADQVKVKATKGKEV